VHHCRVQRRPVTVAAPSHEENPVGQLPKIPKNLGRALGVGMQLPVSVPIPLFATVFWSTVHPRHGLFNSILVDRTLAFVGELTWTTQFALVIYHLDAQLGSRRWVQCCSYLSVIVYFVAEMMVRRLGCVGGGGVLVLVVVMDVVLVLVVLVLVVLVLVVLVVVVLDLVTGPLTLPLSPTPHSPTTTPPRPTNNGPATKSSRTALRSVSSSRPPCRCCTVSATTRGTTPKCIV
jgi:hypothetical protein